MRQNVDLTLNRDFSENITNNHGKTFIGMFKYIPETYQWLEGGIKHESFNYENPSSRKDFDDFVKGRTLVNTGSRCVRSHKLDVRGIEMGEICYECGKPICIPWKRCSCFREYMKVHGGMKESCSKQLNYPTIIR